jgi:hypothetical protein
MYYTRYFEMGKYAVWSSGGGCRGVYVLWFHFSDTTFKCVVVPVSNLDLTERVCHLTNKIYREMLCKTTYGGMTYITLGKPTRNQLSAFFWTPQYKIVLSWDLLCWVAILGRIPRSFTNFITNPELSGPFHISSDIYHIQITEYSLMEIDQ